MNVKKCSLLICAALLLGLLPGCGVQSGTKESAGGTEWITTTQEYYPFSAGVKLTGAARLGNRLLFSGKRDGGFVIGAAEYKTGGEGAVNFSDTAAISLDKPEAEDEARLYGVASDGKSCFYILTGEAPKTYTQDGRQMTNPAYSGRYAVLKYSADGKYLDAMRISDWAGSDVAGISAAADGSLVIYGSDYVSSLKWQGGEPKPQRFGSGVMVLSVSPCSKGFFVSTYIWNAAKAEYFILDVNGELTQQAVEPPEDGTPDAGSCASVMGLDGETVLSESGVFFLYDFQKQTRSKLMRWNMGDYSSDDCACACRLSERSFACQIRGCDYLLIASQVSRPKKERSEVNVAVFGSDYDAKIRLEQLNDISTDYVYKYETYPAESLDRLLLALNSSDPPDLLLFGADYGEGGSFDAAGSDCFDDLYTYIDSDSELSRNSFLPNLLTAMSVNGELRVLTDCVSVKTVAARVSDVGDGSAFAPADYNRMVSNGGKYKSVFGSYMSRQNLLLCLADLSVGSDFVDRGRGVCSFDSPEFTAMLKWCADMGNDVPDGSTLPTWGAAESLLSCEEISTPERLNVIHDNLGGDYVFVGFPLGQLSGSYYSIPAGCQGMAILKHGKNKAGAWEYIRSRLSMSAQSKFSSELPVIQKALTRSAESVLDADAMKKLDGLLEGTRSAAAYADKPLRDIIMSEGEAFLAGAQTAENAAVRIQSRAGIYLSEQYG